MSAPITDLSSSSISSSGHVDGLGRRALAFDRESGAMLERLYVRPELAVFELLLRKRIERIQTVEDVRIARPRGIERDGATGELVVVSEFIAGSRLSDLLDVSSDEAVVPGVDVALGYLIDGLEAVSSLHTSGRISHGLIDPSRTVVTADGQVVFVDAALGAAIERLNLSQHRLWHDFGAGGSAPAEPVRFDATRDVTQVALGALMLVLGRNLRLDEYPDALPSLLMEVIEVAQIRGSSNFAGALQRFLQRSLPLPGRRPFASAEEALNDLRPLVRREIGVDACRQAIVDFVAQMDAAFANGERTEDLDASAHGSTVEELDQFLDSFETVDRTAPEPVSPVSPLSYEASFEVADAENASAPAAGTIEDEDDAEELEISLEQIDAPATAARRDEERAEPREPEREDVYELNALFDQGTQSISSELASYDEPAEAPVVDEPVPTPLLEEVLEARNDDPFAAVVAEVVGEQAEASASDAAPVADPEPTEADADVEPEPEPEKEAQSSRRRKRQQQKSARARKDKLRSTNADQKTPPPPPPSAPPPPPPPRPASPTGWLVAPHRAAASEMLIPESAPLPTRPVPSVPSFSPSPVGTFAQPTYASPSAQSSAYGSPTVVKPPPPKPVAPPPPPSAQTQVKVKPEPTPVGLRRPPEMVAPPVDRFSTLSLSGAASEPETPRAFPWKLALVAVVVAGIAILLGRSYLPGRTAVPGEAGAQTAQASPTAAQSAAAQPPVNDSAIPAGKGRIAVQTQPPGIRVLLDKKPIGETPIQLDATPGRHVLTFMTSGGEVVHNIRVNAGKVTSLDIPVFSGWLSVVAPFVVDLAENGQSIGSSEENRLMLPPGRHRITMSNREVGYSQAHDVDIEPGGVRSVTINPKGTVSFNASPWAEVWLEGAKLGDTPLAGIQVPLGTREFVFRNPQFGEKRVTATVRGNAPTMVSHDFQKQ
jgi:hypothetical protein